MDDGDRKEEIKQKRDLAFEKCQIRTREVLERLMRKHPELEVVRISEDLKE